MGQRVHIAGIEVRGRHGMLDEERRRDQPFVVDVEIEVDPVSDDLAATADYRDVVASVRDVVGGESVDLVETLAKRIAERVAALSGVRSCHVTVHKPGAAERLGVVDVSAQAEAAGTPEGGG